MLGIFLDSETNGLNAHKNQIIEIAFKIIDMQTGETQDQLQSLLSLSFTEWEKSNGESLQVNGFTWEELKDAPSRDQVAQEIRTCFIKNHIQRGSAVFICQNPSFDRAFFSQIIDADTQEQLLWPYHWLDLASMFWAIRLKKGYLPWETGLSKDKIAHVLELPKEQKPHRAMNGVNHLIQCYEKLLGLRSPSLTRRVRQFP